MAFNIPSLLKKREREEKKEAKQEELEPRAPGVMVALDNYEDIFSDFDTRPFSERGLSDDFLKELTQRTLDTPSGAEVLLVLPKSLRNERDENTIKSRLRKHFREELKRLDVARREKRTHGFSYLLAGAFLLLLEAYLIEQSENVGKFVFAVSQAIVLPAGWFLAYTGLEKILQPYGEDAAQHEFYRKLSTATVRFNSYEALEEDARKEAERLEKIAREAREKAEAMMREKQEKAEKEKKEKSEEKK